MFNANLFSQLMHEDLQHPNHQPLFLRDLKYPYWQPVAKKL